MAIAVFLFAAVLTVALLVPRMEASGRDAALCPYLSHGASAGCPHLNAPGASGCPYLAAGKGSGCPYLEEAKGCLHALKHSLELDGAQMERVQGIQGEFLEESSDLKKRIRETTAELDRLFRDPATPAGEISAKRKSLAGLREQLDEMANGYRLRIRGELTEEQIRQIPEGCWHAILAYGYGRTLHCPDDCMCPYMGNRSDVSA